MANKKIALETISTELPRKCGIATFNNNFVKGIGNDERVKLYKRNAIVKKHQRYSTYDKDKIREVYQDNPQSWLELRNKIVRDAQRIKKDKKYDAKLGVVVEFEYGIYQDEDGNDYSVPLIKTLNQNNIKNILIPHTVLANPEEYGSNYRHIMEELVRNTDQIIGLTPSAIDILENVYGAPREICKYVAHGVNEFKNGQSREELKKEIGLENRIIGLTGGFFSDGKDFETALKVDAMIKKRGHNFFHIIPGITHEEVKKKEGERFRNEMIGLGKSLGLNVLDIRNAKNLKALKKYDLNKYDVAFLDSFLDDEKKKKIRTLADVCLVLNKGKSQISSGEIARALESRRITIATETPYSKDMQKESGVFTVKHGSVDSLSQCLDFVLLKSDKEKRMLELANATKASTMLWPDKSRDIVNLLETLVNFN